VPSATGAAGIGKPSIFLIAACASAVYMPTALSLAAWVESPAALAKP